MSKQVCSFIILFLCVVCEFFAVEKPDLRALGEAAIAANPDSLRAAEELKAAEAEADAARTERLLSGKLSVDATGNGNTSGEPEPGTAYGFETSANMVAPAGSKVSLGAEYKISVEDSVKTDSARFSAGVSVPVFVNGRLVDSRLGRAAEISAISAPLDSARAAAAEKRRNTVDSAFRLALDAASADRSRSLAERRVVIAEKETVIARVKCQLGSLSFSELAKIEKAADEGRLAALEAGYLREKKLRLLCASTGYAESDIELGALNVPASFRLPDPLPDTAASPESIRASRARESAQMARLLAGAENAPSFGLSAAGTLPGPVSRTKESVPDGQWSATASVSVPLPTGVSSSRKKAADARLSAAFQGEAAALQDSSLSVESAQNAYREALARERLREQILEQTRARHREVLLALESRTATNLDAERAELSVDEALAALEDDRSARFKAALDIYALCGLDPLELLSGPENSKE